MQGLVFLCNWPIDRICSDMSEFSIEVVTLVVMTYITSSYVSQVAT